MATLTAAQARSRVQRGGMVLDATAYDDTWINEVIAEHDSEFQRYCGEIPDSATVTEVVRAVGVSGHLLLQWPVVTSITSITVNGTVVTSTDYYVDNGIVRRLPTAVSDWHSATYPASVVYVHGHGSPADIKRACALYVQKAAAADSSGSTRDVRSSGDQTFYNMPDWDKKRPTGWSDIDRVWNTYRDRPMGIA